MEKTDQSREDLHLPGRIDWQEPGNLRDCVCPEALAKQSPTPHHPPRPLVATLCSC